MLTAFCLSTSHVSLPSTLDFARVGVSHLPPYTHIIRPAGNHLIVIPQIDVLQALCAPFNDFLRPEHFEPGHLIRNISAAEDDGDAPFGRIQHNVAAVPEANFGYTMEHLAIRLLEHGEQKKRLLHIRICYDRPRGKDFRRRDAAYHRQVVNHSRYGRWKDDTFLVEIHRLLSCDDRDRSALLDRDANAARQVPLDRCPSDEIVA